MDWDDTLSQLLARLPAVAAEQLPTWADLLAGMLHLSADPAARPSKAAPGKTPLSRTAAAFAMSGPATHPFILAIMQRPETAEHLVLTLQSSLLDPAAGALEPQPSNSHSRASQQQQQQQIITDMLALHQPFLQFALNSDLHTPHQLSALQLAVLNMLLSLIAQPSTVLAAVRQQIVALIISHLSLLPLSLQEMTIVQLQNLWSQDSSGWDESALVHTMLERVTGAWMASRRIPSSTTSYLHALVTSQQSTLDLADHAALLAVAGCILLDVSGPAQVVSAGSLLTATLKRLDLAQSTLDPILLSLLLPLLGLLSVPGVLPPTAGGRSTNSKAIGAANQRMMGVRDSALSSTGDSDSFDPAAFLGVIVRRVVHREQRADTDASVSKATAAIVQSLSAIQSRSQVVQYAQILEFAVSCLESNTPNNTMATGSRLWHTDTLPQLSLLAASRWMFDPNHASRTSALEHLQSTIRPSHKPYLLKLFSSLLYILKNEPHADVTHLILTHTIPALVQHKDPFLSSASIRFTLSLLQGDNLDTHAELAGLQALVAIWKVQPRVWIQLKSHLFQWLHRFKNSRGGGRKKTAAEMQVRLQIETAVLDTVQFLSAEAPSACGYDLLPFIIPFIKVPFASPAAVAVAITTLSDGIRNSISSPLAAWNVAMQSFVASFAKAGSDPLIAAALCNYYATVGDCIQVTEQYMLFLTETLEHRLLPLRQHPDLGVRNAAYRAMASFPPPDLYPLLPPLSQFVAECLADPDCPEAVEELFGALAQYEATTMRRPVFKGLAAADGVTAGVLRHASGGSEDPQAEMLRSSRTMSHSVIETYESGKVAGAARAGLAVAVLFATPRSERVEFIDVARPAPKHLVHFQTTSAAIKDLSLTDSPLARFEALDAWRMFWRTSFHETARAFTNPSASASAGTAQAAAVPQQVVESIAAQLIADMLGSQLEGNMPPALVSNTLIAVTGATLAAHDMNFSRASDHASSLVDRCLAFVADSPKPDIQATLLVSLANLSRALHSSDDKRLSLIIEALFAGESQHDPSDEEHLVAFVAGLGIAKVLHHVFCSSTLMSQKETALFLDRFLSLFASDRPWTAGIGVGLGLLVASSALDDMIEMVGASAIATVAENALGRIVAFATRQSASAALIDGPSMVSALWAYSSISGRLSLPPRDGLEADDIQGTLAQMARMCDGDNRFEMLRPHVLLAQNREMLRLARADPDTNAAAISESLDHALGIVGSNKHPAGARQLSLIGIRPLIGLDYSFELETRAFATDLHLLHSATTRLQQILVSRDDPKVLRICGWLVGSALWSLGCALDSDGLHTTGRRDPRDYRRLSPESSILRALHDQLRNAASANDERVTRLALNSLMEVDAGLPAADWTDLLAAVAGVSDDLGLPVLAFAKSQAARCPSKSFVNYFVEQLGSFTAGLSHHSAVLAALADPSAADFLEFACSADGVGKLLELGGLGGSHSAAIGTVLVSSFKVIEILSPLLRHVLVSAGRTADLAGGTLGRLQVTLVDLVWSALPEHSVGSALHKDIALLALNLIRDMRPRVSTAVEARVIRRLVDCVVTDVSAATLFAQDSRSYPATATPKQLWALGCAAQVFKGDAQSLLAGYFVQALRTAFLAGQPDVLPACAHATMHLVGEWIARILDVAILVATSRDGRASAGVEGAWQYGLVSIVCLGWGSQHNSDSESLVLVDARDWPHMQMEAPVLLRSLLAGWVRGAHPALLTCGQSVAKRLITLLECTAVSSDAAGDDRGRASVSLRLRNHMRECLAPLKHDPLLKDKWTSLASS
ncbi:hypothetical protein BC831DRAFT_502946 [Entophlyctis helioformis]|nr:hypothetical protein BC831DRAFT_502946 [Entophlyctis helioformis]